MAKQVKGNHTQNPNRLQKEFFIPCEVFRNEREQSDMLIQASGDEMKKKFIMVINL